jgi:hypothetical protein
MQLSGEESGATGVSPVVSGVAPETVERVETSLLTTYGPRTAGCDEIRRDAEFDPQDAGATQKPRWNFSTRQTSSENLLLLGE